MADNKEISRRDLCRAATIAIPVGIAAISATSALAEAAKAGAGAAKPAAGGGDLKLVSEDDPTAKALKYVHDASKAKREKKGATEGKDQSCSNCQLYTKAGQVGGKEVGKCLMIAGGMVASGGWCASWVKKA